MLHRQSRSIRAGVPARAATAACCTAPARRCPHTGRCHFIWPCSCLQCRCRSYTTCKYVAIAMHVPAVATKYNCSSPNSGLIEMKAVARYSNQGQHHAPSDSSRFSNSSPSSSRLSNSSPSRLSNSSPSSSSRLSNSSPSSSRLNNSSSSRFSNSSNRTFRTVTMGCCTTDS